MKAIHLLSNLTVLGTFILIFVGGLVTSTDSGLAVPDWPLSFGTLFPEMVGGVRFEHTHRVIAGVVMLLTCLLGWVTFKQSQDRVLRLMVTAAVGMVFLQALLGGITVLLSLPTIVSVSHACLAQTFFVLVTLLAWMTSPGWQKTSKIPSVHAASFQKLVVSLPVLLYFQLIVGAWVRHTHGSGIAWHIIGALAVLVITTGIFVNTKTLFPKQAIFTKPAGLLISFVGLQFLLGAGSYYHVHLNPSQNPAPPYEVLLTTFHQTTGVVILVLSVVLAVNAFYFLENTSPEVKT